MKRVGLLLAIALLSCVIALVVCLASPYSPVVGGAMEIEELWAIEDTRQESERPLVTALENYGVPLAYDAQENTFYCTLGMENGEAWPQLHLTAPGAKGVSVSFVDDYTYDYCSDAIREGFAYELFAYTDTEYSYFNVVFTGLPIIRLYAQEEIDKQDVPVRVSMSRVGDDVLTGFARMHARGHWSYENAEKKSYRIEFTRHSDGTDKVSRAIAGVGESDAIILLAMAGDEMMMRDRLSWDMASLVWSSTEGFAPGRTQYVEVFLNEAYHGLYLVLLPFDYEQELAKAGANSAGADSVYRSAMGEHDRPQITDESIVPAKYSPMRYEMYYTNGATAFGAFETYLDMAKASCGEEEFRELARRHMDMDSLLRYELLMQGMALSDNNRNNMYIWAHQEEGGVRYRFALWDLDMSWDYDPGVQTDYWFCNPLLDRVLGLDVDGARGRLAAMWEKMKAAGFTYETAKTLADEYARELSESGAFARDAQRWNKETYAPDAFPILCAAEQRFMVMDGTIAHIAQAEGVIDFLNVGVREEKYAVSLAQEIDGLFDGQAYDEGEAAAE